MLAPWLVLTAATPFAVYAAARFGMPAAHQAFFERLGSSIDGVVVEPMDSSLAHLLGLVLAFAATITVARALWGVQAVDRSLGQGSPGGSE